MDKILIIGATGIGETTAKKLAEKLAEKDLKAEVIEDTDNESVFKRVNTIDIDMDTYPFEKYNHFEKPKSKYHK